MSLKGRRRQTLMEAKYPASDQQLARLASVWCPRFAGQILGATWTGLRALREHEVGSIDLANADENLERHLTLSLTRRIRHEMDEDASYGVEHQVSEEATRLPGGQPPTPDIAFIFFEQPRLIWCIEAKVLRSDGNVSGYVKEVQENYLTCRYSPYFSQGTMLGFLISGDPTNAISNIAKSLGVQTETVAVEAGQLHHRSEHTRTSPGGRVFASAFTCHHFILFLGSARP